MPSEFWSLDVAAAYANPYKYESKAKFRQEAQALLKRLYAGLDRYVLKFGIDDRSVKKAVWMLQIDALDSLRDCLQMLGQKRHRVSSLLFRHVVEALDLTAYFSSGSSESQKDLSRWYDDKIVPNRKYRDFLQRSQGREEAQRKAAHYQTLSRFTHCAYRALLYSYSLGRDNLLVYDSHSKRVLTLPQTISMYLVILAGLIKQFCAEVIVCGLLTKKEVSFAWEKALGKGDAQQRLVAALPRRTRHPTRRRS